MLVDFFIFKIIILFKWVILTGRVDISFLSRVTWSFSSMVKAGLYLEIGI